MDVESFVLFQTAGPIVGANVLVKGTTIGALIMDGRVILDGA